MGTGNHDFLQQNMTSTDLEFKTLTFKIGGTCKTKRGLNYESIPINSKLDLFFHQVKQISNLLEGSIGVRLRGK